MKQFFFVISTILFLFFLISEHYIIAGIIATIWLVNTLINKYNEGGPLTPANDIENIPVPESFPRPEDPTMLYYEIVGMQYRNFARYYTGIHRDAIAIAEPDNPHDPYAVAIYCNHQHIAYVVRETNQDLYKYIQSKGGTVPAMYKIWKYNGKFSGFAYIKSYDL